MKMSDELRCDNKLHGIIVEPSVIEVRCGSRFCGAGKDVVVLHRFDVVTGKLIKTERFKEPNQRKEVRDAS